jgi:hypothetical protein
MAFNFERSIRFGRSRHFNPSAGESWRGNRVGCKPTLVSLNLFARTAILPELGAELTGWRLLQYCWKRDCWFHIDPLRRVSTPSGMKNSCRLIRPIRRISGD